MAGRFSGRFIGGYGTQAAGQIDIEWVPDPSLFQHILLEVRDDLENRTAPLVLSGAAIAKQVEENFDTETDPDGHPWAPWSSSIKGGQQTYYTDPVTERSTKLRGYAENLPPGHSGMILNWRGILKKAATNQAAYVTVAQQGINNDSLFFDTGGLPPYWEYHQEGTSKMPARRFLGIRDDVEVLEIFDQWFQGVIEKAVSQSGRIFARRRDPSRRRAPRQEI